MGHSLNPYTPTTLNLFMDYFTKSNIYHNLHHMLNSGYYTLQPWIHLAHGYEEDLKKYNKVCKTSISYSLWIDTTKEWSKLIDA